MKYIYLILGLVLIAAAIAPAQTFSVNPKGRLLSQCDAPAVSGLFFCQVTGDAANPDGVYVSANGQPYFKLGAAVVTVINFSDVKGNVAPAQLPVSFSCKFKSNVDPTTQTATLSSCQ